MLRSQSHTDDPGRAVAPSAARDEVRLIDRIAAKELRAFEDLYRIYHPRLTRFLVNILHRPHLAEEALNDTMLVVWRRPDSYNGSCKVSTWIFAIAYRTALKAMSRQDAPVEDKFAELRPSDDADPEQELEHRQVQEILQDAMAQLSADHRAVLDLTYFHDAGYREIAEIMDCPVGTVKTRMFHARRHLKDMLAGRLADWL
jgi:RNA polymerase sigma factor (sigma-70 family)